MPRKRVAEKVNMVRVRDHDFRDHLGLHILKLWDHPALVRMRDAFLILFGATLFLSLLGYDPKDKSWNSFSLAPVHNFLGSFGAIISDLAVQSMGFISWLFSLAILSFGLVRLYCHGRDNRSLHLGLRFGLSLIGLWCLAAGLAYMAVSPLTSPFAVSFGGMMGYGLLNLCASLFQMTGLYGARLVAAVFMGFFGLFVIIRALGLRLNDIPHYLHGFLSNKKTWKITFKRFADQVQGVLFPSLSSARYAPDSEKSFDSVSLSPKMSLSPKIRMGDSDGQFSDPADIESSFSSPLSEPRVAGSKSVKPSLREQKEQQVRFDFIKEGNFQLPELAILAKPRPRNSAVDEYMLRQNAKALETVLSEFGVKGYIDQIRPGPVVTLYEFVPAPGIKHSRIVALADDIARSMSARACRVSVVQGRNAIGLELPNAKRDTVYLRSLLSSSDYEKSSAQIPLALGETIGGEPYITDLAKMPHLLIAGTTGSGKSVGVNAMILSILYRLPPDQCRFIMIDPKMLELSVYDGIPHLLSPVVTDPKKAIVALKWTVREMEDRYRRMSKIGVRNIGGFNNKARESLANGEHYERCVQIGFDENGQPAYETEILRPEPMPYLVVVIDEVADLMMVAGKDIESAVQRLAQMARAAGIHLIMATQRPSVDVITGTIKANFPTRISFQVTSRIDARTILGEQGAEQLLGQGDMLYMAGGGQITRLHGPFVSDEEVEAVTSFLRQQGTPDYLDDITAPIEEEGEDTQDGNETTSSSGDTLYDQAVAIVTRDRKASTSYVQRRLQIGYNRAASLIERMEKEGVVTTANHTGKRDILAPPPPML